MTPDLGALLHSGGRRGGQSQVVTFQHVGGHFKTGVTGGSLERCWRLWTELSPGQCGDGKLYRLHLHLQSPRLEADFGDLCGGRLVSQLIDHKHAWVSPGGRELYLAEYSEEESVQSFLSGN